MAITQTKAYATIVGITPYSQSRKHEEPFLEGESHEDYNRRVWRSQALVENGIVCIPASGMHQCLVAAAKYSKKKIEGQGRSTWTAKFQAGIALTANIPLGIKPDDLAYIDVYANADGIRGSGKRVMRRFPIINKWQAEFEVIILDPIITKEVFSELVEVAGMFIGIGRFRPEKGGYNGRFRLSELVWHDDRRPVQRIAA